MGVLRAKVVALATLATVAMLAACAPAAEGGPAAAAPQSAEASATPSATPSLEASESPRPTLRPRPTLSAEPGIDGDYDGTADAPVTRYVMERTPGYPAYYPEADPSYNSDGTLGSGCNPPDPDSLPDGVWRGVLTALSTDEPDLWIWFDLVCSYSPFFEGAPEGQIGQWTFWGLDMNYIVTNDDWQGREIPVSSDAVSYSWVNRWAIGTWSDIGAMCGNGGCDVWIWINDGAVTELSTAVFDVLPDDDVVVLPVK